MSNTQYETDTDSTVESSPASTRKTELAAERDLALAENRRLRELVAASRRNRYRNTAMALCGIGVLCGLLALVVPAASTVLFALGGTGVFGGVLTYMLTPEQFISADIGHRVYAATAESYERLCADLGLSDRRLYVPPETADTPADSARGWLFVPQTADTELPERERLDSAFVVEEGHRGLSVRPTGSGLVTALQTSLTEPLGSTPESISAQLSDALVEEFELAETAEYEIDQADGRISVRVSGTLYGDGAEFDHPVVSMFAVGVATGLDTPVETTVTATEPLSVTLRWEPAAVDDAASDTTDGDAADSADAAAADAADATAA